MRTIRGDHSERYLVQAFQIGHPRGWKDTNFQYSGDLASAKVMRERYQADYPTTDFRIVRRITSVSEAVIEVSEPERGKYVVVGMTTGQEESLHSLLIAADKLNHLGDTLGKCADEFSSQDPGREIVIKAYKSGFAELRAEVLRKSELFIAELESDKHED